MTQSATSPLANIFKQTLSRFSKSGHEKNVCYRIGDYTVTLPENHLLRRFQFEHRLYDRFVLALGGAKYDGWIIDVGANVGDTLAALASFNSKRIICVEPDANWFEELQANADVVRQGGSTVICENWAVGPDGVLADLSYTSSSTAHFVPSEAGSTRLRSLDQIVRPIVGDDKIALIKSDVDGFDAAVLNSGRTVIIRDLPLLYVEAEVQDSSQLEEWSRTIKWLKQAGYDSYAVLDNFGLPLLKKADSEAVLDCLRYTLNLNLAASTRTTWYFDLFATAPNHQWQFDEIMQRYETEFVNGASSASEPP